MSFNDIVRSMFDGVAAHKHSKQGIKNEYARKFQNLNRTWDCWIGEASTPLLEVADLNDLLEHAQTPDDLNEILDHLYRHDATRVDPYKKIENKIIDRMW